MKMKKIILPLLLISDYMSEKEKKINIKISKDMLIKKTIYKLKNEKHK